MLIYLVQGLIPLIITLTRNVVSDQVDKEKMDNIKNLLQIATMVRIMNVVKQYDHNFLYSYRLSLLIIISAF